MKIRVKGTIEKKNGNIPIKRSIKESFLQKAVKIIWSDIQFRIYGIQDEERQKLEDYKRFCEMARK